MSTSSKKQCASCKTSDTAKWYAGPTCKKCYRKKRYVSTKKKPILVNCLNCGIEMIDSTNSRSRKFCSSNCSERYRYQPKQVINKCAFCNTEFTHSRVKKYCSDKCCKIYAKANSGLTFNEKIKHRLRSRLWQSLNGGYKSGSAVRDLGCSIEELKSHLESKFHEGMSWDNYGKDGWHIDHIKPLASYDLSDPEEFKRACHYSNLQPLWAEDNLRKGSK